MPTRPRAINVNFFNLFKPRPKYVTLLEQINVNERETEKEKKIT
jgi:hypothetical protein